MLRTLAVFGGEHCSTREVAANEMTSNYCFVISHII